MKKLIFIASALLFWSCAGSQKSQSEGTSGSYNTKAMNRFVDGIVDDLVEDFESAEKNYQAALLLDSNARTIHITLAEDYLIMGQYDRALASLRRAVQDSSEDALELLADIHIRQHNFDKAIVTLERLCVKYAGSVAAHYRLITIYEIQNKPHDAARHYQSLLDIVGSNSSLSLKLGEIYMRNKRYDAAVETYDQARKSDPNNTDVLSALAQAYRFNKDIPKAIETYESLAALQDDNVMIHASLGFLAIQQGLYDKAWDAFKKADAITPNNSDFLRSMGFASYQLKRFQEAALALEKAATVNPRDIMALTILAPVYQELKSDLKADTVFERILALDPDNEAILNNYSYHLAVRGKNLDRAKKMVERALQKAPESEHYLDTMGWVLFQLGKYEQALDFCKRAWEKNTESGEVADHLGDIYSKLNKKGDAVTYWKKALELNAPDSKEIRKKIETIK